MGHGGAADGPPVGRDAPAVSRVAVTLDLEGQDTAVRAGPRRTGRLSDPSARGMPDRIPRTHATRGAHPGLCAPDPTASDPCHLEGKPSPHLTHGETEALGCRETCSLPGAQGRGREEAGIAVSGGLLPSTPPPPMSLWRPSCPVSLQARQPGAPPQSSGLSNSLSPSPPLSLSSPPLSLSHPLSPLTPSLLSKVKCWL